MNKNNIKEELEKAEIQFNEKKLEYGQVDKTIVKFLSSLFPETIPIEKYSEVFVIVKILEKLSRISSLNISDAKKLDAYKDIVGYGLLGFLHNEKKD